MGQYAISCCSTADLTAEHFAKRNINWIPFHAYLDDKHYLDDLGKSISSEDFYKAMVGGADPKTSQPNVEQYCEVFEKFMEAGTDLIHVTLSSGISGAFNSASIAAQQVREKYPERKLYIIDSLCASSGFGLLMDRVADKRDEGLGIDELKDWIEANKLKVQHWFFSTDLTFFVKGGRVSKTAGFIGGALKICPLLNVDYKGCLIPREKIRTRKRAIKAALGKMEELAQDRLDYNDKVYISHSAVEDDARELARQIEETFTKLPEPVLINNIGTTIGAHTGPGTVALFFWGDERVD